jgi:hypothetical protein
VATTGTPCAIASRIAFGSPFPFGRRQDEDARTREVRASSSRARMPSKRASTPSARACCSSAARSGPYPTIHSGRRAAPACRRSRSAGRPRPCA